MSEPTPASALTDEQIEYFTGIIRECAADSEVIMPCLEVVDRWLAAVIARAKREVAEEIADAIERLDSWEPGAVVRSEAHALARQIGVTR